MHPPPPREGAHLGGRPRAARGTEDQTGSALADWVRERLWYGAPGAHDALARLGLWRPLPRADAARAAGLRAAARGRGRGRVGQDGGHPRARSGARRAREARACSWSTCRAALEIDDRTWRLSRRLYGWDEAGWDRGRVVQRLKDIGGGPGWRSSI